MRDRLYRSRQDRVIGGLAAGLARNLGIDVTWVRLGWVVLAFATQGIAILLYVALLFVIPEEPEGTVEVSGVDADPVDEAGTPLATEAETQATGTVDRPTGVEGSAAAGATTPWRTDRPPTAGSTASMPPTSPLERWVGGSDNSRTAALVVGAVLVIAGAWILLRRFISIDFDLVWPLVAVALGVILVVAALRRGGRSR